jgi:hypothetical protein
LPARNSRSIPGNRTLASLLSDVRAVGKGAPLRAGYEISKRFGGHSLIFGRLARIPPQFATGVTPFDRLQVPEQVRQRTLAAADRITSGVIELFGQEHRPGDPPDWNAVIHADGSWPATDWWRIDLRSERRIGDVKWAWELGRHRHLVLLARAAYLDPSNPENLDCLERQLDSWLATCPPEVGIHWSSNLEIALRSISWLQILSLTEGLMQPQLRMDMWRHLYHAGRHLVADLPYTKSTMRNNHLLGDALGLMALGKAFGGKEGDRWFKTGDRLFDLQLNRQMRSDGSMIEDSLSYHRFVLEMLSMRVILGDADESVRTALTHAAQFLARLGVLDGEVPQFGDWDEGRVFVVAADPARMSGSVRLALSLIGSGGLPSWRASEDEVAWFTDEGVPEPAEDATTDGSDLGGGIARAVVGPYEVWLKGGSGPSHGHADLSSVAIAHRGCWLTGDPGTGTYNGSLEVRDYFRSSMSHNVVRVDGEDQLIPLRVFRWANSAEGRIGEPIQFGDATIMWTVHDAYSRSSPPRRVGRVVVVSRHGVDISDFIEGPPVPVDISLPIHPGATWEDSNQQIKVGAELFAMTGPCDDFAVVSGATDPYSGWWSETYGTIGPATLVVFQCNSGAPITWGFRPLADRNEDAQVTEPVASEISLQFRSNSTRLHIDADDASFTREM